MNEDEIIVLVSQVSKETVAEKELLLDIPEARNGLIELLIEMQTSATNRRMGAAELANTTAYVCASGTTSTQIVALKSIAAMPVEKWNILREIGGKAKGLGSECWREKNAEVAKKRCVIITEIMPNIRAYIFKKFGNKGFDYEQLVNDGVLGVVRAMEKFDVSKGKRFTDYAMNWVNARIYSTLEKQPLVHGGSLVVATRIKIKRTRERMEITEGREVTAEEIMEELGISRESFDRTNIYIESMSSPVTHSGQEVEDERTVEDSLSVESEVGADWDDELAANHIAFALETLEESERAITVFRLPALHHDFTKIAPLTVKETIKRLQKMALEDIEFELLSEKSCKKKES